jgi:predicted RNase H-related nuclease YkuK (DUF458 family)
MWNSETYGQLGLNEIPDKLKLFYDRNAVYGEPMELAIGTDSQNHCAGTKIVTVISMICKGHGGIFFYETEIRELIKVVKQKLETETYISLETAKALLDELDDDTYRVLIDECPLSIHIDAGNAPHGKTRDLIQAITGWVHATGYECEVKPDSYSASTIADRISK